MSVLSFIYGQSGNEFCKVSYLNLNLFTYILSFGYIDQWSYIQYARSYNNRI